VIRRREFISLLGSAAATWPVAARAQQAAVPLVGALRSGTRGGAPQFEAAFRQGLASTGFEEGRNIAIDYRYDEGAPDRLSALAADLVRQQVAVIYAADNAAAIAVKAATATIPIVFRVGGDPVELGLVAGLSRPGGNLTGVSFLITATVAIRLQMLHEVAPRAADVGLLVNPLNPYTEANAREALGAASGLGLKLHVVRASSNSEIDAAFAALVQQRVQALAIDGDPLFTARRQQIAALTGHYAIPAIYTTRELPNVGLLMSYGASPSDAERLGGIYVGRILKGERPADLPVQQSVKIELVLNMIAAKVLGVSFPLTLLGRADEVIE
jgi:putative tryptophan/tyrosine transport system substrate-binding protein